MLKKEEQQTKRLNKALHLIPGKIWIMSIGFIFFDIVLISSATLLHSIIFTCLVIIMLLLQFLLLFKEYKLNKFVVILHTGILLYYAIYLLLNSTIISLHFGEYMLIDYIKFITFWMFIYILVQTVIHILEYFNIYIITPKDKILSKDDLDTERLLVSFPPRGREMNWLEREVLIEENKKKD